MAPNGKPATWTVLPWIVAPGTVVRCPSTTTTLEVCWSTLAPTTAEDTIVALPPTTTTVRRTVPAMTAFPPITTTLLTVWPSGSV